VEMSTGCSGWMNLEGLGSKERIRAGFVIVVETNEKFFVLKTH
jgi:hypothetical protein